jgi:rare lipoprotein A
VAPDVARRVPQSEPPEDPALETLTGRASYYSDRLAGRSTASGVPYDPQALTAASRDLPFGTRLRVTRVDTGASVTVTVNDRGPFGDRRRIVDLSRRAAEALDMIRAGVIEVRVEILGD